MKSSITKLDQEFSSTGTMWRAIYDARYDEKARDDLLQAEIQLAYGGKDSTVTNGAGSKKGFVLFSSPTVRELLNGVEIAKLNIENKTFDFRTCFPELLTKYTTKAELLEVNEYKGGFEARLKVKIVSDIEQTHDHIIDFFDTRYIVNCDKYKLGDIYEFHIGALVNQITHRKPKDLNLPLSKKAKEKLDKVLGEETEHKTISTKEMYALNPLYDDCPENFIAKVKFTGLQTPSYNYPLLDEKEEMYLFELSCKYLDQDRILYTIPALMTDGVIASSYKIDEKNVRRKLEFSEGDPVDIVGVLQGHLAEL